MIHAGGFTTLMLALLDGMSDLDSDCLNGDRVSNVTTVTPAGKHCPEVFNYTAEYCQCYSATMNNIHRNIQAARDRSISFAKTEDLQDIEQAVKLVKEVLNTPAEIIADIRNCTSTPYTCLSMYEEKKNRMKNYTDTYDKLLGLLDMVHTTYNILLYYIPPIIVVLLLCGMIGNGTLLYIFYKHPETRSGPKILLVNLTVSDVLVLLLNFFGKFYLRLYPFTLGQTVCHIYTFLVVTPPRASILSIMVLSIIRYIAVTAMPGDRSHKLLDYMPVVVTLVWTAASLQAVKPTIDSVVVKYDFSDKTHCDIRPSMTTVISDVTITCFLPFAVIAFFVLATYRRLRGGAQKTSGKSELDLAKERNVRVLPALTLCFTVTYPPFYLFWLIARINKFSLSSRIVWFYYMVQFLININSALNPIVLYLSSEMFREYFNKYLRIGCKKEQKEPNKAETSLSQTATSPWE